MSQYKKFFAISFCLSLIGAASALASPILLNIWGMEETGINEERIVILLVVLLATMAVEVAMVIFREKFAKQYNITNFKSYMELFLSMDYDSIVSKGPANIIQRIQQAVGNMYSFMTGDYISICTSVLVLLVILVIVFQQNIIIGGIMLLAIPLNYLGYKLLNKELAKKSKKLQEDSAKGYQNILAYSEQVDYLKQCSDYKSFFAEIDPSVILLYKSMADINVFAQSMSRILESTNGIIETMSMVIIVYNVLNTEQNPIMVIIMVILFPIFFGHLSVVTNANLNRQGMKVSMEFVEEMKKLKEKDGEAALDKIEEVSLSVNHLTAGDKVLNVKAEGTFHPGDIVLIKGPSGIGKSTLAKALVKFRECEGISINGQDIRDFTNASLRKRINYLSQNVPIIKGSMKDNLCFNCEWSEQREKRLAHEPFLKELLLKHPLESEIAENGANLSGGEKQKIALARVLGDDVDVLILDEFTSNIDKGTAEEILKKVTELYCDKIVFIISHDELSEKYASKILEL